MQGELPCHALAPDQRDTSTSRGKPPADIATDAACAEDADVAHAHRDSGSTTAGVAIGMGGNRLRPSATITSAGRYMSRPYIAPGIATGSDPSTDTPTRIASAAFWTPTSRLTVNMSRSGKPARRPSA